jgi:hypothetical protein
MLISCHIKWNATSKKEFCYILINVFFPKEIKHNKNKSNKSLFFKSKEIQNFNLKKQTKKNQCH